MTPLRIATLAQETPLLIRPDLPQPEAPGVLPIDKPGGWSSFDIIRKLRRMLGLRKIGHAGTLDPMATGLVICLLGPATRLADYYMAETKRYTGVLRLGAVTPSYDAETEVTATAEWAHLTPADLDRARAALTGPQQQTPPMYSAVKIGGERLYKKARRGEEIERPARAVVIERFELGAPVGPDVPFRVVCSKGTYIRSLAHDFGALLGCGAHLAALRRTHIGAVGVEAAWTLPDLEAALAAQRLPPGAPA